MRPDEYDRLTAGAEVLARDWSGDKVLRTADGQVVKLFRVKKLISSAHLRPHALRFARAADRLRQLAIPTVEVRHVIRLPHIKRQAVVYDPLPGRTLRQALADAAAGHNDEILGTLAGFLARLHAHGVYFRAIHFGNVLLLDDGNFGLIDVSETHFYRRALDPWRRARNLRPIARYQQDRAALHRYGMGRFIDRYLDNANLGPIARALFAAFVKMPPPLGPAPLPFSEPQPQ